MAKQEGGEEMRIEIEGLKFEAIEASLTLADYDVKRLQEAQNNLMLLARCPPLAFVETTGIEQNQNGVFSVKIKIQG